MEKQDIPNKVNTFKLSELLFGGFFWAFIYLSTFFSLLMVTYLLIVKGDIELAKMGIFIFKGLLFFYLCYLMIIIIKLLKTSTEKSKIRFEERKRLIKEEIKQEILKELHGRNSKTSR